MKRNENTGKKRNNKRSQKGKRKAFPNAKLVYEGFLTWGRRRTRKYPKMKRHTMKITEKGEEKEDYQAQAT